MEAVTGTLGLNVPGLIWHAINFIVLLVLLRLVLYKPVVTMLDDRARRVRESMEQADQARRAAEPIRARAEEQSKRIIGEAAGRAQDEANRIIAAAQATAEQEHRQMMAEVRSQLADMIVTAVDRVTRNALDSNAQRTLVQQFLTTDTGAGNGSVGSSR